MKFFLQDYLENNYIRTITAEQFQTFTLQNTMTRIGKSAFLANH